MVKDLNIIVFGDSITQGFFDKEKCGWVNRLRLSLENDGSDNYYSVFNLGISGEITGKLKSRFKSECLVRYDEEAINIIIFAIGINDTQNIKGEYRVTVDEFRDNISSLINDAKEYTDNILFMGLTKVDESKVVPLPWDHDKCYLNEKVTLFDKELSDICLCNKIDYLYLYDLLNLDELFDGVHPNAIGHQKISDVVLEYLSKKYL